MKKQETRERKTRHRWEEKEEKEEKETENKVVDAISLSVQRNRDRSDGEVTLTCDGCTKRPEKERRGEERGRERQVSEVGDTVLPTVKSFVYVKFEVC